MEELWFAIATGVISGVVSAAILFVIRTLIVGHLLPWHHDLVYRGINVDGRWFASAYEMAQDFSMNVQQRAGVITGDAQFVRREGKASGFEDVREFTVEGRIQDRYVTLTLNHKNRQRIGVVTFLLEPVRDGRQLEGLMCFVSMNGNDIESTPVTLARDSAVVKELREATEALRRQGQLPLGEVLPAKRQTRVSRKRPPARAESEISIE